MSQDDHLKLVREIYDAVGRGDVPAILDRVTDDVDWAAEAASRAAPWYGPRTGQAGVASFFSDLATSIERNVVHGSDAPDTAAREIAYFFSATELHPRG